MELEALLLEEWKQNVALYIDQDRRGFERIKMFLTVQGALFVLYGLCWRNDWTLPSLLLSIFVILAGFLMTLITHWMSYRAHAFILLRKIQGVLLERKLNALFEDERLRMSNGSQPPVTDVKTSNGMICTFLREHLSFGTKDCKLEEEQRTLLDEVERLSQIMPTPITNGDQFYWGIGHLRWLCLMYWGLYVTWFLLLIIAILAGWQVIEQSKERIVQLCDLYL